MRSTLMVLLALVVYGIYAIPCNQPSDCPDGTFCRTPRGLCGGEGICDYIPASCTPDITHVCGCDRKTYPNECFAYARNVSIFVDEECSDIKVCSSNKDCTQAPNGRPQYCQLPNGQCQGRGRCADIPEACEPSVHEVCGCDGITYRNDCDAAQLGVNVQSRSHCNNPTCVQNGDCDQANTYCSKPLGNCDAIGECVARPMTCTTEFNPVCGCDGRYFGNSCYAAVDGTSVHNQGSCKQF